MKSKLLLAIAMSLLLVIVPVSVALAATTADVTVTATPSYVGISCNETAYNFGTVSASDIVQTWTSYFGVTNTSSIVIDVSIGVTTTSWSGGTGWTHSETATPGADTAGLEANAGGTWDTGDVIIRNASPLLIADDQAASTDFNWGMQLHAPTSFSDGEQKQIIVRLTAAAAS